MPDVAEILKKYFTIDGDWHLNAQGKVDVLGSVTMTRDRSRLPVNFGHVTGSFDCFQRNLRTLEGAPEKVGHRFVCGRNQITSLQGGPLEVGEDYQAHINHLTSLAGAPNSVGKAMVITYYPDTPLLKLFHYKTVRFTEFNTPPVPQIWKELFDPQVHPELQGGGKAAMLKAVAILSKAGLYHNNPNARP